MKSAAVFAVASLLLAIPMAVHAQVTTYADPADFDSASTGDTSYSFPVPDEGTSQQVASPYTVGPLSFSSTNPTYYLYLDDVGYGSGQTYLDTNFPGPVNSTISLNGATALALTFGTYNGADSVTVEVNGAPAAILTDTPDHPASEFFGVTDSTPITSLSISITGDAFDILNFEVGTAVPESSTWMMTFGGLGILGAVHYSRRRSVA